MNMDNKNLLIAICTILFFAQPITASAGMFGPSNIYECILEEMPGAKNDRYATEVYIKCKNKFTDDEIPQKKKSLFGVKTFSECVLKYGKDVSGERAVRLITISCDKLYPEE